MAELIQSLTPQRFRNDFPEFADKTFHPEQNLLQAINQAVNFVDQRISGSLISDEIRFIATEYMTGHLRTLAVRISEGNTQGGLVGSSSVGSVSVSMVPPPMTRQFQHWCAQTIYGQNYLALLASQAPAGIYYGGSVQRVFR